MKISRYSAASVLIVMLFGLAKSAWADSSDARCEFYKEGDKQGNKTGPCRFSQHQGNVYIDLHNGQTFSLVPGNKSNHYKDEKGNNVERVLHKHGEEHVYKWDNKKIVVKFNQHESRDQHGEPTTKTERVHIDHRTHGTELESRLRPGSSTRYILHAKNGQDLYVRVAAHGSDLYYQIFNPDGSFLLDQMTSGKEYRGQLWQSGDHVVEVINRSSRSADYNIIFGLD